MLNPPPPLGTKVVNNNMFLLNPNMQKQFAILNIYYYFVHLTTVIISLYYHKHYYSPTKLDVMYGICIIYVYCFAGELMIIASPRQRRLLVEIFETDKREKKNNIVMYVRFIYVMTWPQLSLPISRSQTCALHISPLNNPHKTKNFV